MGFFKFTVLAQGVYNSTDIFNFLADGSMLYDSNGSIKNMDDVLLYGRTIKELKRKLVFCKEKNLKLEPSKLNISEQDEFGGTLISSEMVTNE